ncbi:beta-1 adrenergic receptor-like [Clytia hemisphaerica]|uniref:G-protein coupled receptors family 1 profile domain-containing protein n=1 Tax=Clytia hemisphaerica TaxID=252671 RepID=A0A7M5WSR5_9CNID
MEYGEFIFVCMSPANAATAILLNLLVMFYIWKMKLLAKNRSIVLFVNLSLADILLGLTISAIKVIGTFKLPPDHILNLVKQYLASSFIQISLLVSISTNIIVTSERLLLVKQPFIYRQITKGHRVLICIAIWIITILATAGFYFTSYTYELQFIIISTIIFTSLPWPIICFVWIKIIMKHRLSSKNQADKNDGPDNVATASRNKEEEKFLTLCFRTFIVFTICWVPYASFGVALYFSYSVEHDAIWLDIQYTVHLIAFVNSTINPAVFLYTTGLKKKIKQFFCSPAPLDYSENSVSQQTIDTTL